MTNFDEREPRREGKPAPPAEILAAPANKLETDPHPQAVTATLTDILDALEAIIGSVDDPAAHGIDEGESPAERAQAFAAAVGRGDITVSSTGAETDPVDGFQTLEAAVETTKRQHSFESTSARNLLSALATTDSSSSAELSQRLVEAGTALEEHEAIGRAIQKAGTTELAVLGEHLETELDGTETDTANALQRLGKRLQRREDRIDSQQRQHESLSDAVAELCAVAGEEVGWEFDESEPAASVRDLARALDDDSLRLVTGGDDIAHIATALRRDGVPESAPAERFVRTVAEHESVSESELREALAEAVNAIDRAETVVTRLDGIDRESVRNTADRLLATLSGETDPIATHLRDRITDIKETTQRSNEADLLTLYAARRELRYYDRTLLPQISGSEPAARKNGAVRERIEAADERRDRMRRSYPTEYPDCDHTIPIYLFDLVSELLDSAREHHQNGESQRAIGLVSGAEQTLDWIEGLYETHSYFVLLKELRG